MYLSQIDEMLIGDLDLQFVMPWEFEDLNPEAFREFNRKLYAHRFDLDYESYSGDNDIDLHLSNYYSSCETNKLIPSNCFFKLVEYMLVVLESRSFTSLFSNCVEFYNTKYSNEYLTFFLNLFSTSKSEVARDNLRRYITEIFDDKRYWANNELFDDSLLFEENLQQLQIIRAM
ncbi:hypothetical protein [Acinetobacter nosocomialis]|uniref:hypothetical protein n=1 Tax=Acinetobacter nosocomialis TaxID=106654 RepID=UPI001B83E8D7|nr:hypothetical protein [Acinetobacter nosocomialis]MBR7734507.1 hypothetical protein [Acinetobacter nosocomialis]